jgi:hypothetical protein
VEPIVDLQIQPPIHPSADVSRRKIMIDVIGVDWLLAEPTVSIGPIDVA